MNDREMLELAAKAAGLGTFEYVEGAACYKNGRGRYKLWNPLTDDGDAMRLAVKLKLGEEK